MFRTILSLAFFLAAVSWPGLYGQSAQCNAVKVVEMTCAKKLVQQPAAMVQSTDQAVPSATVVSADTESLKSSINADLKSGKLITCRPVNCDPKNCKPENCDPAQCDPANCDPAKCDPADCAPGSRSVAEPSATPKALSPHYPVSSSDPGQSGAAG